MFKEEIFQYTYYILGTRNFVKIPFGYERPSWHFYRQLILGNWIPRHALLFINWSVHLCMQMLNMTQAWLQYQLLHKSDTLGMIPTWLHFLCLHCIIHPLYACKCKRQIHEIKTCQWVQREYVYLLRNNINTSSYVLSYWQTGHI